MDGGGRKSGSGNSRLGYLRFGMRGFFVASVEGWNNPAGQLLWRLSRCCSDRGFLGAMVTGVSG